MTYPFRNGQASHEHSLQTLNILQGHHDFMESVGTLIDMGCGEGRDLEWWATRTTADDNPQPLNIRCTGIDRSETLSVAQKYKNIQYLNHDFEQEIDFGKRKFDIVWCHDTFQYVIDPFETLRRWKKITSTNGMLVLILPQSTNLEFNSQAYDQRDFCYYNYTLVSLIHMLAVTGWDCAGGFFKKAANDPWLHAIVYNGGHEPLDPRTTTWYQLAEKNLLPKSAADGINRCGYLRQKDLILPWLDHSLTSYAKY